MDGQQNNTIKLLTNKVLSMVASEVNKPETQVLIKRKIIIPVVNMIYKELHPYIMALIITISIILLLSLMTFLFFILYYFKK